MKTHLSRRTMLQTMGSAALAGGMVLNGAGAALPDHLAVPPTEGLGWCPEGPDTPKLCLNIELTEDRLDAATLRKVKQIGVNYVIGVWDLTSLGGRPNSDPLYETPSNPPV